MTAHLHWVPDLEGCAPGTTVEVTGDEAHHAVAVRRVEVGEHLALTDGAGTTVLGPVAETGKRRFTLRVDEVTTTEQPQPSFTVVQALPKGDRGELAVEMLTELGVQRIVPWAAQRSVAVWRGERATKSHAKWSATAREAAKQARRPWFPVVAPLATTKDVLELVAGAHSAAVLHEEAELRLAEVALPVDGEVLLVVGPEGGVSPEEIDAFAAAGAPAVRLGDEVLRTSTAGVAAVAALLARTSRWG